MICPQCTTENIDGTEVCEECGASLDEHGMPQPSSAIERSLLRDQIAVLKIPAPVAVAPSTRMRDVLQLLVKKSIGCVLIVEEGQLLGIFSERDALHRLGTEAAVLGELPVGQFMTSNPEALDIQAPLAFALQKMDVGHYRHLPVLEHGKVRGVISVRDILRYITDDLLPA